LNLLELKKQAGIDDNPDQEGLDLFAELIVRECASIADNKRTALEMDRNSRITSDAIKQHFGVK
jgi:hypothetical protein